MLTCASSGVADGDVIVNIGTGLPATVWHNVFCLHITDLIGSDDIELKYS